MTGEDCGTITSCGGFVGGLRRWGGIVICSVGCGVIGGWRRWGGIVICSVGCGVVGCGRR
jgi:hypothetical protein